MWTLGRIVDSTRIKLGLFVFLRAKVIRTDHNGKENVLVVQLVDRFGRPSEPVERYVREDQVITVADAIKSVGESMKR